MSSNQEPQSFNEVIIKQEWFDAMRKEIEALEQNKTWKLTEIQHGKKSIGCNWVYKIKYNDKGDIERYKDRLVVKGYTQLKELII